MGSRTVGHFSESTVVNWQRNHVDLKAKFHNLTPRFKKHEHDRNSYQLAGVVRLQNLQFAQVHADRSRKDYHDSYEKLLNAFRDGRVLQVRWNLCKEVPSFSPDFVYLYLNRFGKVDGVYPMATNACLVAFANEQTLRVVMNKPSLGLPYGRLFTRHWNPVLGDNDFHRVISHLEHCAGTKQRVLGVIQSTRHSNLTTRLGRGMARVFRETGPTLRRKLDRQLTSWHMLDRQLTSWHEDPVNCTRQRFK